MSDALPTPNCPDVATLRALLDGMLPEPQQGTTQAHVDCCLTCEAALRQMTAGGESWVGLAEKLKEESGDDPKLVAAMERLKTDDGSASETGESVDPQRTIDFLQPSDDPKSLGRLGQHEVLEVVGWGGMGVVLKAYDPGLHRVVAVKVLASHLAHHAVARKRFIREAQAAAAVCHDNVVTIHAIDEAKFVVPPLGGQNGKENIPPEGGTTNVLPKIVMQFVAGGSLQERIDQEAPLELKEILRIAMQTAAGLAAAHAQGVVHRDVKPANILLENGVQRVKLTDFGLARVMDDASLTLSGVIAGTPQYMAPEQAWGRDVDARADLFSLGAVMYAMCSGHSPFRARTTMAVLKRVCEDAPRPLRAINPEIPEWLVAIIEKLLAKNPDERFQTAIEVSELLAKWLAHVQQPMVVEAPQFVVPPSGGTVRTLSGTKPPKGGTTNDPASPSSQISPKIVVVAMVVTGVLLGFLSISVIEGNPRNMDSFLAFSAVQLLATFAMASAFRAAWNTSRWVTFIAVLFFLPFMASLFGYLVSNRDASGAMQLVGGLQALAALAYECVLLFVRPLFPSPLNAPKPEGSTGRRRLITAVSIVLVALSGSILLITMRSNQQSLLRAEAERSHYQQQYQAAQLRQIEAAHQRELRNRTEPLGTQPFPKPQLLSTGAGMGTSSMALPGTEPTATIPEALKPLLGRWVVVSSEGATLGSPVIAGAPSSSFGPPGLGGAASMPPGAMVAGSAGANVPSTPLQWIEFAADQVVLFDGRETALLTAFPQSTEPRELQLYFRQSEPFVEPLVWRTGIYRVDRDRLIICWSPNMPIPTEFAVNDRRDTQLLVLRREWSPPPNLLPPGETPPPPPRAVIPFTANEAKRYQEAWANSANVPVETTNSLGMKLRVLPPGAFDPAGTEALSKSPMLPVVTGFSQPIYLATQEVTVAQFRKFVEATQYETTAERLSLESGTERPTWHHPGIVQDSDQHPVVRISWRDAQAFCRWLSDTEQQQYRLPTMTEWAFAARAGLAFGTPLKLPHNSRLKFFDTTAPVGGDNANLFGLHDLFGNVSEWANDSLGADNPDALSPGEKNQPPQPFFMRAALGGGYQSSRKREDGSEWLMLQVFGTADPADDVGFRVARVITRDVEVFSSFSPHVKGLIATPTRVTIPLRTDRAKAADSQPPTDSSTKERLLPRPVIAVRGLVPVFAFPVVPNFVDFEIERASQLAKDFDLDIEVGKNAWSKVDLTNALAVLDRAALIDPDPVPGLLLNPVFSMPLPLLTEPWPKELVTHPGLSLTPPKSKYEVQQQLFRFLDFEVTSGQSYAYRVRLKFTPPGKQQTQPVLFTPWSSRSNWVTVEELRDEKEH